MKIKFTEFRYFMVEMLSILIIVGVLFVAGIIRYQDVLVYQVGKVIFEEEKTVATETVQWVRNVDQENSQWNTVREGTS